LKLSIIVPAYNVEDHLGDSLASLERGSLQDFEVLIVDDGSVDRTAEVARRRADRDSRFILITTENGGSGAARNRGLDRARGEYVAFLDADDWVEPEMFERLLEVTETFPYDAVSCDLVFEHPNSSIVETSASRAGAYTRSEIEGSIFPLLLTSDRLTREWPYRLVTKVFRRQHLHDHGIRFAEHLRAAQDFTFSVEAMYRAQNFFYLRGLDGYHYRKNPTSRTNSGLADAWANYRGLDEELAKVVGSDPRFVDQLAFAELHGDLSSLTYLYRNLQPEGRREARTTMTAQLTQVDRARAFTALDWRGVPTAKRIVCQLMRRRQWFALHLLLVARSVAESRQREKLLKHSEDRS